MVAVHNDSAVLPLPVLPLPLPHNTRPVLETNGSAFLPVSTPSSTPSPSLFDKSSLPTPAMTTLVAPSPSVSIPTPFLAAASSASLPVPGTMDHRREKIYGKKMSVLTFSGQKYLIGVQIAHLLQRETYNLYRSMKVKKIPVVRASTEQVDYLLKTNVVKPGTRSVTFIPIDHAMSYIHEEIKKVGLRKKNKDKTAKAFTVDRSKIKEKTPPPMIVELEVEDSPTPTPTESSTPATATATTSSAPALAPAASSFFGSAFEVLCAAAEDEWNSRALNRSSNGVPTPAPAPAPAPSTTTATAPSTLASSASAIDVLNSLLPSISGVAAGKNEVYLSFSSPKAIC